MSARKNTKADNARHANSPWRAKPIKSTNPVTNRRRRIQDLTTSELMTGRTQEAWDAWHEDQRRLIRKKYEPPGATP